MDSQFLGFAAGRFLLSALIIGSAAGALGVGLWFYRKGSGSNRDESEFEMSLGEFKIKVSSATIGAIVIAASVIWGYLGVLSLPKASMGGRDGTTNSPSWKIEQKPSRPAAGALGPVAPEKHDP